jgi:phage terminase Nu1 subunit (DNA packaging protein)
MDTKFTEIHTIITTMDNNMKTFIHKLGEVQSVTADIPETVQNKITELMVNHKKKILENLANIEKKVMQCATTIDAHLVS